VSKSGRNRSVLIANETLYQLSYTPILPMKNGFVGFSAANTSAQLKQALEDALN
jgi:hypothetical protein